MKSAYYQLIVQINKAIETCDTAFLATHVAEDMQWNIIGNKQISGKMDFLKCCSDTPFKDNTIKITVTQILIDGDRAAAEGIMEAETLSGKPYRQQFCDLYLFEHNLVKKLTSYFDTAHVKETFASEPIHQNH